MAAKGTIWLAEELGPYAEVPGPRRKCAETYEDVVRKALEELRRTRRRQKPQPPGLAEIVAHWQAIGVAARAAVMALTMPPNTGVWKFEDARAQKRDGRRE